MPRTESFVLGYNLNRTLDIQFKYLDVNISVLFIKMFFSLQVEFLFTLPLFCAAKPPLAPPTTHYISPIWAT